MLTPHQMIMSALGKGSDCLNRLFTTGVITPNQISADLRRDLDTVAPHLAEIVVAKFEEELVRMRPIGGVRSPSGLLAALLVPVVPSRQVGMDGKLGGKGNAGKGGGRGGGPGASAKLVPAPGRGPAPAPPAPKSSSDVLPPRPEAPKPRPEPSRGDRPLDDRDPLRK